MLNNTKVQKPNQSHFLPTAQPLILTHAAKYSKANVCNNAA